MVKVFAHGPGDLGSIPGRVMLKTLKKLMLLCLTLSIIRVKKILEKEQRPPLQLGVVAMEKGASGSPSITIANFNYLLLHKVWIKQYMNKNWQKGIDCV